MSGVFVYIIGIRKGGRPVAPIKVGISSDPARRLADLQTACPYPLISVATFFCPTRDAARTVEAAFHQSQARNNTSGEWFDVHPMKALQLVCISMRFAIQYNIEDPELRALAHSNSGLLQMEEKLKLWADAASGRNDNRMVQ